MRILHLDSGRTMRGGQWQALYLMVGQKTIGLEPVLLAPGDSPLLAEAGKRGVECGTLSPWAVWRESRRADLTHVHDARSHTWGALLARRPLVVSRRVGFPVRNGFLSRWKYRRADRYLAISEFVRRLLIHAGIEGSRIGIVYDGVPVDPKRETQGDRFIAVRFDDPRKGDALAGEAARKAGIALHYTQSLVEDLNSARAFVYLTDMEGLGSAALVALSAGVPVIASKVGGLPEIVHHGENGLLVANDPVEVAAAMMLLRDDPALAQRLGARGRGMVLDGFTLAHMALRTLHEYKKVLA